MLAVHAVSDQLPVRIQVVKDRICVSLLTRSEYYNLEVFSGFLEALNRIGPDIDASAHYIVWVESVLLSGKVYLKDDVGVLPLDIIHTVNQGLIHVENGKLRLFIRPLRHGQDYFADFLMK